MSDALRVLMVDSERSWRGGQEQVRLLMKGLAESSVTVALAAPPDGVLFGRAQAMGVECVAWNARAGSLPALRRAMRTGGFDLVHSHASRAHGAVAVARSGRSRRVPHVVSRHVVFPVGRGPLRKWKYRQGADAYIAISRSVRDALVAGGVPAGRITVVPSAIDVAAATGRRTREAVRREFGVEARTRVVGNIAALTKEKAQDDLVRAAALVSARPGDTRFFIVGDGALRGDLERLVHQLGLTGRVTFTGFREDAQDLLMMFDVLAMSSSHEGLGVSIMDAQAAGIPVVATRTGGIPEIVEDGVSGLLVPPRSPQKLAAGIERMLTDESLRDACARTALEQSRGYDYRLMVYKTLDVYRRLCPTRHIPPGKGHIADG